MIIIKRVTELAKLLDIQRKEGKLIGFVPTMGALHEGHISLVKASRVKNNITVSSIFINPVQFNDEKDFEKYPITIEKDIEQLENASCDILFLPSVQEIYPAGLKDKKKYNLGFLETILEGKFRPGHFQGVCLVVERLLEIVKPNNLYLGQKDYQQCMVIQRLIELMKQSHHVKVNICPTQREKDGLAMSSRNMRLTPDEREIAAFIYKVLKKLKQTLSAGDLEKIKETARLELEKVGFKIDYVEIANATTLHPISTWDGKEKLVALVAAFINEVRLIDNIQLN